MNSQALQNPELRDLLIDRCTVSRRTEQEAPGGETRIVPVRRAQDVPCRIEPHRGDVRERGYGQEPRADFLAIFDPGQALEVGDLVTVTRGAAEGKRFWVRFIGPFTGEHIEADLEWTREPVEGA